MKKLMILMIFILATLIFTTSISAQESEESPIKDISWIRLGGPPGGVGYDIRMDPNNPDIMFVSDANAGIHKSIDRGKTWFISNNGIDLRSGASGDLIPVFSVTIDPNNSNIVWVGMLDQGGVFYSDDGGETWERRITGFVERIQFTVRGITVQPGNSDVVFVGADIGSLEWGGESVSMTRGVIYKSSDRGMNWRAVWRGENLVRYVMIDSTDNNIMYASTGIFDRDAANSNSDTGELGGVGILKSTDAGESWYPINNGLNNLYINSIAIHPENSQILLAGSRHANWSHDDGAGLYITYNGGENWEYVIGRDTTAVEFSNEFPNYAYAIGQAEFYRSVDGGKTWESASNPLTGSWGLPTMVSGFAMDIQIDPEDPLKFFVNSYQGGNFYTEDGGDSWSTASIGYTGSTFRDITVHPSNSALVYATGRTGPFVSRDGGSNWVPVSIFGQSPEGSAIAVDPNDPYRILSADLNAGCIGESYNWGANWFVRLCIEPNEQEVKNDFMAQGPSSIVFSLSNPSIVYAGSAIAVCIESLFEGCSQNPVISLLKSEDGGSSWIAIKDPIFDGVSVLDVAIHPDDANIVWAALAGSGIVKSEDGGKSWINLSKDVENKLLTSLVLDLSDPQRLYAGLMHQGVFGSKDGGKTWEQLNHGMNPEEVVRTIVIDPVRPNILYAGTENSGVYLSEDFGNNWKLVNIGLDNRSVLDLGISADGLTLYAVTNGGGAFRLSVHDQEHFDTLGPSLESINSLTTELKNDSIDESGIQIDGNADDWINRKIFYTDPEGDAETKFLDLTTGYAFIDEEAFYFMINVYENNMDFTQIYISFENDENKILTIWDQDLNNASIYDVSDPENFSAVGQTQQSSLALGAALEGKISLIDLSGFGPIGKLSDIIIWGGSESEGTWREVERWEPNKSPYTDADSVLEEEIIVDDEETIVDDEPDIISTESAISNQEQINPVFIVVGISITVLVVVIVVFTRRKNE